MKDGAIMCNAGHFDVEISIPDLEDVSVKQTDARANVRGYCMPDGRCLYLLAQGRLVNLAAGDGHPAEIMDMSFALQALSAQYLAENGAGLAPAVYDLPISIDERVASLLLAAHDLKIDTLTAEQERYLQSWDI